MNKTTLIHRFAKGLHLPFIAALVAVLALGVASHPNQTAAQGANKMYWTDADTDKIQRANLDGSNVEDLVTAGLQFPEDIAVDCAGGKMYWTDWFAAKIQRANLDGSNVDDLLTAADGLQHPTAIALDIAGGKMYWGDDGTGKIQRANLDGSNVEDLVGGLSDPSGIDLDMTGGKMYWTDWFSDKIQRASLDGSNVEDLVTAADGLDDPTGIALDMAGGKMYCTTTKEVSSFDLDGSDYTVIINGTTYPASFTAIKLDLAGPKMYWTDAGEHKIQRANLDGSNVEDPVTGLDEPFGIALCIEEAPPTPPPEPVGGIAVPVDKLGLVPPWMGLVTLAGLAALGVVLVRRHTRA
jgi:DNA-binding beta-propeller fold protein YncE